ncbi:siderophore-interacting protein [Paracoccus aurantiacus]|uniref:Siderophore-interacting protein n=1 Tax=Paracoccus aurantiacus TaxID=2599412 RepID=A0A5C6SBI0_9RHOB|nr:siderophore-interacting protein [Paracoccus aurantiacus]TXB71173.1 siderophore-interacting protein [Paracoccus aurantiacus]
MRHDPLPPFQSEATVGLDFKILDARLRREAAEHGLDLHSGHGRSTWIVLGTGEFGARKQGNGAVVYARAHERDWLFTLKEAVAHHVAAIAGAVPLDWSGPEQAGELPPNFSLARVASVRRLSAHFLRLRLEGQGLGRLARDMIHFRLVLPVAEGATEWPRLSETGQTVWPQELHRPAYTVAAIDPSAGWLETDIFIHSGGRICAFAAEAVTGTEIGLTGPGGGGIPQSDMLLIGGDETAYPALSRIIAAQAPDARITCHLFGATADYPFAGHPNLHLCHDPSGEARLARRLSTEGTHASRAWIATERARLQPLKQAVLAYLPKSHAHLAAYWNADSDR